MLKHSTVVIVVLDCRMLVQRDFKLLNYGTQNTFREIILLSISNENTNVYEFNMYKC